MPENTWEANWKTKIIQLTIEKSLFSTLIQLQKLKLFENIVQNSTGMT